MEIVLGGKTLEVQPISLGTLKKIGMAAAKQRQGVAQQRSLSDDWSKGEEKWYEGTYAVIADALRIKPEDVEKMENVTLDELAAAVNKIYEVTGLSVKKVDKPGTSVGEVDGSVTG